MAICAVMAIVIGAVFELIGGLTGILVKGQGFEKKFKLTEIFSYNFHLCLKFILKYRDCFW